MQVKINKIKHLNGLYLQHTFQPISRRFKLQNLEYFFGNHAARFYWWQAAHVDIGEYAVFVLHRRVAAKICG